MNASTNYPSRTFVTLVVFTIAWMLPLTTEAQPTETSFWEGTLNAGPRNIPLKFIIQKQKGQWTGTLYSPTEGHAELPMKQIEISENELKFAIPNTNTVFEGQFQNEATKAIGIWKQRGAEIDFEIEKTDAFSLPELTEFWQGTLEAGGAKLEMGLKIYRLGNGDLIAKLDSYTQRVKGIPVDFSQQDQQYEVKKTALGMTYKAERSPDGKALNGTFKQGGQEFPLDMERVAIAEDNQPNRPQTPQAPFPYQSEDVKFTNTLDNVTLAGTLTIPEGEGPFPAAILISGSGSQDRDETIFDHKPFWVISDYLSRRGVAVLRFDDRGFGESTGVEILSKSTSEDFARDVAAGLQFLSQRPEIASRKIGLIGHSEGGIIAPIVASQNDDVAFIISMAGTGVNGGKILISQIRAAQEAAGVDSKMVNAMTRLTTALVDKVYDDQVLNEEAVTQITQEITDGSDEETTAYVTAQSAGLLKLVDRDWSRFFINHDPAGTWRKVTCPVLVLNGDKDLQVLADLNLPAIEAALKQGGNTQFVVKKLTNLNHLFQETQGPGLATEYGQLEQTISPEALNSMQEWLEKIVQ